MKNFSSERTISNYGKFGITLLRKSRKIKRTSYCRRRDYYRFISPLIGVAIVIWWIANNISDDSRWYQLEETSLLLTLIQVLFRVKEDFFFAILLS